MRVYRNDDPKQYACFVLGLDAYVILMFEYGRTVNNWRRDIMTCVTIIARHYGKRRKDVFTIERLGFDVPVPVPDTILKKFDIWEIQGPRQVEMIRAKCGEVAG